MDKPKNRIKEVLEEKGIKQTWLAEKLGKSFCIVNSYVCNRRQPSLDILFEIADILQVNPKDLIKYETKIKGNKIFAPLKNKELVLTPEERVRQEYICRLVDNYGYALNQMAQEVQVNNSHRGQGKARADIVIWRSEADKKDDASAVIVVECKAEYITIREEDYFQGYNYAAWASADFFVTTNLKETRIFKVIKGKLPKRLEEIVDIPQAEDLTNAKKSRSC